MLGTGARYAEYGITGGFFLFTQILILGFAYPDLVTHSTDTLTGLLAAIYGKVPTAAQPAIQSLLVALALLSVFITGLLLDLVGSVFVLWEAWIFRKQLKKNAAWIEGYFTTEMRDYAEDYKAFLVLSEQINVLRQMKETTRMFLGLWRPSGWRDYFRTVWSKGILWQRTVQQLFRRLEFALIAKVLASGAKADMMSEQISICRMSRAITAALYPISFEVYPILAPDNASSQFDMLFAVLASLAIFLCATAISLSAYSRFTLILFALVNAGIKHGQEAKTV